MKNKDLFATYDDAWHCYYDVIVPQYGVTRLEYGFGRWLWLDAVEPVDDAAEQFFSHGDGEYLAGGDDFRRR